jgi:squalene synthase HpnC
MDTHATQTIEQAATRQDPIETPTGKGADDENFPVASFMIARNLRPHVMRFYSFARAADDIADNPSLSADDKINRLDAFEAGLSGAGPQKARALGRSLIETGVSDRYARDLLVAFRQDANKSRYENWEDLLGYCRVSANPVGRFLMDLHGEEPDMWAASDALCTVLQIVNHLQDCQKDYRIMDRVYIPEDMLAEQGLTVSVLNGSVSPPRFRSVLDQILDRCDVLLEAARKRPVRPRSRRLHAQTAMITTLATRLSSRLRLEDPLAGRVKLSKLDFVIAATSGLRALLTPLRG